MLWIDDEIQPDDALLLLMRHEGIVIEIANTAAEGLSRALAAAYDAILVDLRLPDMYGGTVVRRLVAAHVRSAIFVVTGHYLEPEIQIEARRLGIAGVLYKPLLDAESSARAIRAGVDRGPSDGDTGTPDPPFGIVAASRAMQDVVVWAESLAHSQVPVLVTGETGTGKELVARAIHDAGQRSQRPFVPVNCAAVPDALFESELFGHRKGAFTSASEDRMGLAEAANGGTLFLDEVAEIPPAAQARLLRCLEGGRVRRIGETGERALDVRVIAATNRKLRDHVSRGRFREDLYFRLSGASRDIPPLRDRQEDIAPLVRYWVSQLTTHRRPNGRVHVTPEALRLLQQHAWPGNVRELRNVLEHALCLATGPALTARDIAAVLPGAVSESEWPARGPAKERLQTELEAHRWNRTETARALGVGRTTLWRWLRGGNPEMK